MIMVFDTETTGLTLHPRAPIEMQPHLIEFGGAFLSATTGERKEQFQFLVNPGIPIPEDATRVNGITNEMVAAQPRFADVWPFIAAKFDKCKGCVAHNAPFDLSVLQIELMRANIKFEFPPMLDTVGIFRAEFGYDPKLTDVYEFLMGVKLKQDHRAGSDVDALVEIVQKTKLWSFFS